MDFLCLSLATLVHHFKGRHSRVDDIAEGEL